MVKWGMLGLLGIVIPPEWRGWDWFQRIWYVVVFSAIMIPLIIVVPRVVRWIVLEWLPSLLHG